MTDIADGAEILKRSNVSLVETNKNPDGIPLVNSYLVAKKAPNDLVELAKEIQKADSFVHANAYNKLQVISEQVRFLQQQAQKVLLEAKTHKDLHQAACNFVKIPGNIYHLYERTSGQKYFSMLSPEEWSSCPHKHFGSFRLEHDQSWTPLSNLEFKNNEIKVIHKILSSDMDTNLYKCIENSSTDTS